MDVGCLQEIRSHGNKFSFHWKDGELWSQALNDETSCYGILFFHLEKQQLDSDGDWILEGIYNPINFDAEFREECVTEFNEKYSFPTQIIAEFFEEMEPWFQGEEALIKEYNREYG